MNIPKRPVRKYKNFAEYLDLNRNRLGGYIKCVECDDRRWIYDPSDPPDYIEGHKLCRRIACPTCNGTGRGKADDYKANYKYIVACHQARLSLYRKYKKVLKKLTEEELTILIRFSSTKDFSSVHPHGDDFKK